jgi:hypothetical protein
MNPFHLFGGPHFLSLQWRLDINKQTNTIPSSAPTQSHEPNPILSEAFNRTNHGLPLFPNSRSENHRHYVLRPLRAVPVPAQAPQPFL